MLIDFVAWSDYEEYARCLHQSTDFTHLWPINLDRKKVGS